MDLVEGISALKLERKKANVYRYRLFTFIMFSKVVFLLIFVVAPPMPAVARPC